MDWARILAYITGTVDQELLLRNEYLVAENRILKAQLKTPLRLTDAERMTLAEIAHRLGRKALEDVANVVKPDTPYGANIRTNCMILLSNNIADNLFGNDKRHTTFPSPRNCPGRLA
jgi:hypothetical protein